MAPAAPAPTRGPTALIKRRLIATIWTGAIKTQRAFDESLRHTETHRGGHDLAVAAVSTERSLARPPRPRPARAPSPTAGRAGVRGGAASLGRPGWPVARPALGRGPAGGRPRGAGGARALGGPVFVGAAAGGGTVADPRFSCGKRGRPVGGSGFAGEAPVSSEKPPPVALPLCLILKVSGSA